MLTSPVKLLVVLVRLTLLPAAETVALPPTVKAAAWLTAPPLVRLRLPATLLAPARCTAPAALITAGPVTAAVRVRARLLARDKAPAANVTEPVKALAALARLMACPAAWRLVVPVTLRTADWSRAAAEVIARLPPTVVAAAMVAAVTLRPPRRAMRVASPLIEPPRLRAEAEVS